MKRTVVLILLFCAAAGCSSSSPEDKDLEAWVKEVQVLKPGQIGDREYEEIGFFEERERIVGMGEDSAMGQAKYRLKRRAAKVDADAIVIVACGRDVRPSEENMMTDQGPAIVCKGVAIRWKI